ncbi:R3H and coiled-coil domain-containing protein 1 [Parambassis ranga]|uniref:R3H and coiled-coil domain-containing protein 1 n=1 Tax=Parambassis ranga TaxID=210632 RepID=A0A6P7IG97_9TELE|nr:R3H and coiled-coil domain-containing protein 1-like [Parambassis ranga]
MDDLETYQQKNDRKSVLLFPPLPSRLRYLIHKTIEEMPELTTFSVGESWCRRVVVCWSELRSEVEEDSELESNNSSCEEPQSNKWEMEDNVKPKPSVPTRSRAAKRPDKPLYMPRAARERLSLQNSELQSSACCSSGSISSSSDSCCCPKTTENLKYSSTFRQELCPSVADSNPDADGSGLCPQEEKHREAEWDQTQACFADMTIEEVEKDKGHLTSGIYDAQTEDRSTDTGDVAEQIKAHLKEAVTVSIEQAHSDYSIYENVCIDLDGFGHVIEIYDFPAVFKTDDLLDAFTEYSEGGMKIKWVDNTHALGVFSNELAAVHALSICHPLLKTRALAEGSKKAQGKAYRRAEFIQPVKERPRTDCAVARRMVTRALGIQGRSRVQRY